MKYQYTDSKGKVHQLENIPGLRFLVITRCAPGANFCHAETTRDNVLRTARGLGEEPEVYDLVEVAQ